MCKKTFAKNALIFTLFLNLGSYLPASYISANDEPLSFAPSAKVGMAPIIDEEDLEQDGNLIDLQREILKQKYQEKDIVPSPQMPIKDAEPLSFSVENDNVEQVPEEFDILKALQNTYYTNPTLKEARENLRLAYELVYEARTGFLPDISGAAGVEAEFRDNETTGNDDESIASAGINITQPLFRSGRTDNLIAKQTLDAQSSYYSYLNVAQQVMLSFITSYVDVVTALSEIEFNTQNVARLEKQNDATSKEFEVGLLTLTDVSQSQARLARAKSDLIQAQGLLEQRLASFAQVAGIKPSLEFFEFPDELIENYITDYVPNTLEDATSLALRQNPNLLASRTSLNAAEAQISVNRSELFPELSLNGGLEQRDNGSAPGRSDSETAASIGVVATIPIFNSGVDRSRIRQAKIDKFSKLNAVTSAERNVTQNVTTSWQNFMTAEAVLDSSKKQLEASETAREAIYNEREVGSRTVLEALDADQELLEAQLQIVNARRNFIISQVNLLAVTGQLKSEHFNIDPVLSRNALDELSSLSIDNLFSTSVNPMDNY